MSIILQAHKCKICLGVGATAATGLCIATPLLISSGSGGESSNPSVNSPEPQPVLQPQIKPVAHEHSNPQPSKEGAYTRLATLKQKKETLRTNVENRETIYRNSIAKSQQLSRLDHEFNQCKSKHEVDIGITEQEKNDLKSAYDEIKKDKGSYEELKKLIDGELKTKESVADNHQEDENKYKEFEKKYEEVNGKYEDLEKKKSNENLISNYKVIYQKLSKATADCSIKDVIKINDWLGEINNAAQ